MALTKLKLSQLLATYGQLLTEKQRDVVAMYCDCDCTLSEIAAEHGISRQGVRDAIVKAEASLVKLEEVLHLAELTNKLDVALHAENSAAVVEIAKKFVEKE